MVNHKLQAISGARFQVTEPEIMLLRDEHCFLEDLLLRFPQKTYLSLSLQYKWHFKPQPPSHIQQASDSNTQRNGRPNKQGINKITAESISASIRAAPQRHSENQYHQRIPVEDFQRQHHYHLKWPPSFLQQINRVARTGTVCFFHWFSIPFSVRSECQQFLSDSVHSDALFGILIGFGRDFLKLSSSNVTTGISTKNANCIMQCKLLLILIHDYVILKSKR